MSKMKIDMNRVIEALEEDECIGFCLACGEEQPGVEPDAREYECDVCGQRQVYGAEEVMLMGAVE
jgi:hypothetical protein